MAATESSSWEKIRQGVIEAETLIGKKQYNLSMVKSKQTLEYMIKCLCERADITEPDLEQAIDMLYDNRVISKTTCEHYHKILMFGNQAVQDGGDSAYNANQAYHLLSQEVYSFSDDYPGKTRSTGTASKTKNSPSSQNERKKQTPSRSRKRDSHSRLSTTDLMRLGTVLVCVIVVVLAARLIFHGKSSATDPTAVSAETTPQETMPVSETMAETTPAAVYKTSDNLNVRSEPSTSGSKLGLLPAGTIVDYVEDYDSDWAVINYDGTQAYVSKQFLVHD